MKAGRTWVLILAGCFVMTAWVQAANLNDVRTALAALRAGTLAPDAAASVAQGYLDANPASALAMAYLGSVRTLQGAAATVPWRRLAYMGQGFKLLDQSVEAASGTATAESDATEALLVAGLTHASIPSVFKRRQEAIRCLERLPMRPGFASLDRANQALVHAWLAALLADDSAGRSANHRAIAFRLDPRAAQSVLSKPSWTH